MSKDNKPSAGGAIRRIVDAGPKSQNSSGKQLQEWQAKLEQAAASKKGGARLDCQCGECDDGPGR